ncbi:MAG: AAA family ATPase [Candidatus Coproplasma sp.]
MNINCSFIDEFNAHQHIKLLVDNNDIFLYDEKKYSLERLLQAYYCKLNAEIRTVVRSDEEFMPREMTLFNLDAIAAVLNEGENIFIDLTAIEDGAEKTNFLRQIIKLPLENELAGYLFILLEEKDCEDLANKQHHTCQIVKLKKPVDSEIREYVRTTLKNKITDNQKKRLLNSVLGKSLYEVDGIITKLNNTATKQVNEFLEKLESNGTCFDFLLQEFLASSKAYSYWMNDPTNENGVQDYVERGDDIENDITVSLNGKSCHNYIILGNAGSGKTTMVNHWAFKNRDKYIVLQFDSDAAIAGTGIVGAHEQRLNTFIDFVENFNKRADECGGKKIVMFIDEIHRIMGNGGAIGVASTGDMLKTHLMNKHFFVVGATTIKEYEASIAYDEPLSRRFWTSDLHDMTMAEVVETLQKFAKNNYDFTLNKGLAEIVIENSKKIERKPTMPAAPVKLLDFCLSYCQNKRLPLTKDIIVKIAAKRCIEE